MLVDSDLSPSPLSFFITPTISNSYFPQDLFFQAIPYQPEEQAVFFLPGAFLSLQTMALPKLLTQKGLEFSVKAHALHTKAGCYGIMWFI